MADARQRLGKAVAGCKRSSIDVGLFEHRPPPNLVVYHHFPYYIDNVAGIHGYTPFLGTPKYQDLFCNVLKGYDMS